MTVPVRFEFARGNITFDAQLQQDSEQENNWVMVWQDEFDGDEIDSSKWSFEENCWGGGNGEQQCYTNREDNAYVDNGVLTIIAKKETFIGPDNPDGNTDSLATLPYTSARLRTINKGDWTYGRFEIKAKLPSGQGTWPAIWMLPTDYVYGPWAASGEIDIMEAVNLKAASDDPTANGAPEDRTYGTLHFGRIWPGNVSSGAPYRLPDNANPADGFHEYAIEWEDGEIRWYVDDVHFATQTQEGWYAQYQDENGQWQTAQGSAPFNERFHLLLNVAVGGAWAGNTNETGIDDTVFPQTMEVDYVRVYECSVNPSTGEGCASINPDATQVPGVPTPEIIDPVENLGAGPVFNIYLNSLLEGMSIGSYNPNGSVAIETVEDGEHGNVLQITQTGDTGNMYVNTDPAISLTHFAEYGELVFDVRVINNDADSSLLVKMDSGWPAVSDTTVPLPAVGEWQEIHISVADLLAQGNRFAPGNFANVDALVNPFVVETTGPMTYALDNIRFQYSLDGVATAVIFDDVDHPPFGINKYVASGTVDIEQVVSSDGDHGEVKQVTFNTNESVVYFQTQVGTDNQPAKLDVSNFDTIDFDLLVLNDDRAERTFNVKMECGNPCGSGDFPIEAPAIGEWKHYSIPIADLVTHPGSSLDLTQVDTPLVVFPAWGNQQGVVMQIDNVKLVGDGDDSNNTPINVTVSDTFPIFDDGFTEGWSLWDCCANAAISVVQDAERGPVANVDFFGPAPTVSGLSATLPHDLTAVFEGTLEFDMKLVSPSNDPGALLLMKVEGADGSFAQLELVQSNEGAQPQVGQWQHFTYDLSTLANMGLNLEKVKLVLIFPEWDRAQGAVYQLDNIIVNAD
ncbi:family 16 glycosylhydrolase [Alteromonas pelagimontana]|uniref:Family 16 glycosylhydrolase n=2 Tax=Alteromonas pelagimontana TaxID=1858656 RepID=A0A6N3IX57_9ALTE|nr:family 16 glycosylhydrolase [Alteromonas pelagimontana]